MKSIYLAVATLLALCLASCFGDPRLLWRLQASKAGETVQICLSHESDCPQPDGISLSNISVYRYDSVFDNELVWDTSPGTEETNDRIDGIVTYGVPPKNWHSQATPPPLVCGKAYLVNPPASFFALKCDGTVVTFDFQHLEEFFRQQGPPASITQKGSGH